MGVNRDKTKETTNVSSIIYERLTHAMPADEMEGSSNCRQVIATAGEHEPSDQRIYAIVPGVYEQRVIWRMRCGPAKHGPAVRGHQGKYPAANSVFISAGSIRFWL